MNVGGSFTLPCNSITLNRMSYGAMQLAGPQFSRCAPLWQKLPLSATRKTHLDCKSRIGITGR